jgi:hypothetical protein
LEEAAGIIKGAPVQDKRGRLAIDAADAADLCEGNAKAALALY